MARADVSPASVGARRHGAVQVHRLPRRRRRHRVERRGLKDRTRWALSSSTVDDAQSAPTGMASRVIRLTGRVASSRSRACRTQHPPTPQRRVGGRGDDDRGGSRGGAARARPPDAVYPRHGRGRTCRDGKPTHLRAMRRDADGAAAEFLSPVGLLPLPVCLLFLIHSCCARP